MAAPSLQAEPFLRYGPHAPNSPVVIAVPHAGRGYPQALLDQARLPRELLELLEDRFADRLPAQAAAAGATVYVATTARAWIDLNRAADELDPGMVAPPPPGLVASARARGGLGLIPRRVPGHGEIYSRPLTAADVAERLDETHAPWHAALAGSLAAARARFGVAVLLDLHSMPPLPGAGAARIVVGDRFGSSAGPAFVAALLRTARAAGLRAAANTPYAGGHALARHGRPRTAVHAVQLEICRSLYLDEARRAAGPGLAMVERLIADMVEALTTEAGGALLAAE